MAPVFPTTPQPEKQAIPRPWIIGTRGDLYGSGGGHYTIENPTYTGPCECGATHPPGALIAWLAGGLGDADIVARTPERARHDPLAQANARLIVEAVNSYDSLRRERDEAIEALRELREASTVAYKAGRIAAEPFVKAGNVLSKLAPEGK